MPTSQGSDDQPLGVTVDVEDDRRKRMRASDSERQEVVEILKTALDDGRLRMDEYVERMEKAYEALTIGDLLLLHDDLPLTAPPARRESPAPEPVPQPMPPAPPPAPEPHGAFAELPTALKVLWTIWFAAVSINVVVWVLVGVTSASLPYPWPLWVAGPFGAALFGVSAPTLTIKRARRARRRQFPPMR